MYIHNHETLKVLYQKLSDIQEEAMRTYQEASISNSQGSNGKNRFFNLHDEYGNNNMKCANDNNDSDRSDCNSDTSSIANVREDGYSSDCSDMSSFNRRHSELLGKRVRKTRQVLDSKRNSVIIDECASDTDASSSARNGERKRRSKQYRTNKTNKEHKNSVNDIDDDEKSHKRRSWTDSGVSLSRTDQSRCGTFENAVSGKNSTKRLSPGEDTPQNLGSSAVENIEADNPVLMRRRSVSSTQRKLSDSKSFNRLSQLTNRSSLTNVTILTANSMTSLSSMISPSELDYLTDDSETSDTEAELNNNLRKTEIEKGSLASVTSSSTVVTDTTTMESLRKKKEESGEKRVDHIIASGIDPNHQLQLFIDKLNIDNNEDLHRPSRNDSKRRSIMKRMKAHFRPRPTADKNYKDVSSEFSFEKIHNDKETEQNFEVVTPDVLKRLRAEESELANSFVDDFEYYDDEELVEDKTAALERLSSTPNKTFIGKFFKRSKSYAISPQLEKKNKSKKFNRNSLRASVRSNPDICFKNDGLDERGTYTQSLEHLDVKNSQGHTNNRQDRGSITSEPYFVYDHNTTRVHHNSVKHSASEYCIPQQPPMSPPLQSHHHGDQDPNFDMQKFQSLHSVNDQQQCSCNECLHAEYLDFLEFQRFRRYYSSNQQQQRGSCCSASGGSQMAGHSRSSSLGHVPLVCKTPNRGEEYKENIVAPLAVTKGTEREARNFRTSKYESFV